MILQNLRDHVQSIIERDPAAHGFVEVLLCYPGLKAVYAHKVSHWLWQHEWKLAARALSQFARFLTGIEIHPGAVIGRRLFIDHGSGTVIGETAEIGDDCTLYHGVTLGGASLQPGKRHPTLGDNVIVGSGAQILGAFEVGDGARIGANAVVVSEVPAHTTVGGVPARSLKAGTAAPLGQPDGFLPYGTPCEEVVDPLEQRLAALAEEVASLRGRLAALEAEDDRAPAPLIAAEAQTRGVKKRSAARGRA